MQLGLMSTYILDAIRYKEGAFMAAWLTMGAANVAMIFSQLLLKSEAAVGITLLIFLLNALTLFLAGGCRVGVGGCGLFGWCSWVCAAGCAGGRARVVGAVQCVSIEGNMGQQGRLPAAARPPPLALTHSVQ